MDKIYEPAEDSFLMSHVLDSEIPKLLKSKPELKFLEIGVGSGIGLKNAKKLGVKVDNILGTDINDKAIEHCRTLGFQVINSNLFSDVFGKFDLIIFNPPYLPEDKREPKESRQVTTAGKHGNEIIIRFLQEAKAHLLPKGKIILITSSLSKEVNFEFLGYRAAELKSNKFFFERLVVWECLKI